MAPAHQAQPPFSTNEKVLCFHHEMLYDAKILEVRQATEKEGKPVYEYRVHYKGWKNTWDDWVPSDRIRPINDENRLLQNQLKIDITGTDSRRSLNQKPPVPSKKGRGQGSEMGSGRGSEDPNANPGGRRRGKDNDIEKVGDDLNSDHGDPESLDPGLDIPCNVPNFADTSVMPVFTGYKLGASTITSRITPPMTPPLFSSELSTPTSRNEPPEDFTIIDRTDYHGKARHSSVRAPAARRSHKGTSLLGGHREDKLKSERARTCQTHAKEPPISPTKSIAEMTFEDIDSEFNHQAPSDPTELMHSDEIKRCLPHAPLLSGTLGDSLPNSIEPHPQLHRAVCEANSYAHKIQFFRTCDSKYPKAYIAGIPPTSFQHAFDPPGTKSQFQINLYKSNFHELRLPIIINHIAKAKTKKALKKFVQGLVDQIPIENPPKWDFQSPEHQCTSTFQEHKESLRADQRLINYLESLTGKAMETDNKATGLGRFQEDCIADFQEAIPTTNAILIIQMCQVLTKLPGVQEDQYRLKPMVRIAVPEHLKYLLVDDWENITKNLQLVDLPSKRPVNFILDEYFTQKRNDRPLGSPDAAILEEFHSGMKVYFQKALGKLLLYRFERDQYADLQKYWITTGIRCEDVDGNSVQYKNLTPGDIYGGEHLLRLIVSFPELIAQTNMDAPSVARLREEIMRFTTWLSQNTNNFFVNKYVGASQEYIERATASGN